ncbi:hypothetical protein EVG20_g10406 [Dentipellis fragilis]|uniref:NADP-dependent oxidoreductase domain-containing protein n=1 Tax=Dentipellis fragilis TaxID=205917 RepID=A0A4Y9XSN9_9AGAM|nr:hypothetical protein EVG20_g10406 [Dentipellis fragilis]
MRRHLDDSLKALNTDTLEMWYLHGPDRSTPYEVTLKAVNEFYEEGKFKRFGISNYMSWEVAEMVQICRANGYIQPTVHQGIYNAIHRAVEPELFPCLRKYGISFYEFNPLGGGFFTGRYHSLNDQTALDRYWKEPFFKALAEIQAVADKHNLTVAEVALRWISHHSFLKRDFGDSVLIGASSVEHIKQNLVDLEKGPLRIEIARRPRAPLPNSIPIQRGVEPFGDVPIVYALCMLRVTCAISPRAGASDFAPMNAKVGRSELRFAAILGDMQHETPPSSSVGINRLWPSIGYPDCLTSAAMTFCSPAGGQMPENLLGELREEWGSSNKLRWNNERDVGP